MSPRLATLAALALALSARAAPPTLIRTVQVFVPEGRDFMAASALVRGSEGRAISERLVDEHVRLLGDLGWVDEVSVDLRPVPRRTDQVDLSYTLRPRDRVEEIRFEGNRALESAALERGVRSRPGQAYDLRQALDDAHQINLMYRDAGYSLSGVLDSRNVEFEDGVLTFRVRESHLAAADRARLEVASGSRLDGPLDRAQLADAIASGDPDDDPGLALRFDRRSGAISLGSPRPDADPGGPGRAAPAAGTGERRAGYRRPARPERMLFRPPTTRRN